MNKIDVYVADDHPVVRKGMIRLLRTFERVGVTREFSNGLELIKELENQLPHAVILDIEMPVMGGMEVASIISRRFPDVKILIMTMHNEEVLVRRLLNTGIHGFLSKSAQPEEIEEALYSIVDNDFYANKITSEVRRRESEDLDGGGRLSNREIEILLLICQELSPQEISDRLKISQKTFFNHRANILEKTGARGNVGLLKYALQLGVLG